MATASRKTAAKKATKSANKTADTATFAATDAFKSIESMGMQAQQQFADAMSQFTGKAEDMREYAENITAELTARFEAQQQLATEINADFVEAAKTEITDAVQFTSDLGAAKSVADAMEIQQAYWTNLFQTRTTRMQDLTAKTVEATKETISPAATDFGAFFDTSAFEKMFAFPAKA